MADDGGYCHDDGHCDDVLVFIVAVAENAVATGEQRIRLSNKSTSFATI